MVRHEYETGMMSVIHFSKPPPRGAVPLKMTDGIPARSLTAPPTAPFMAPPPGAVGPRFRHGGRDAPARFPHPLPPPPRSTSYLGHPLCIPPFIISASSLHPPRPSAAPRPRSPRAAYRPVTPPWRCEWEGGCSGERMPDGGWWMTDGGMAGGSRGARRRAAESSARAGRT